MDNSTSSDNSNNNNGNNNSIWDASTITSLVALFISIVALVGTTAQVLQQYYASPAGYANCEERVMGEWSKSKRRRFRWGELRFEVQFEAPVLFVCPPSNQKGPVKNEPVHIVTGEKQSLQATRALLPADEDMQRNMVVRGTDVHTADNERASWVTLLSELQNMEKESRDWQLKEYGRNPPDGKRQASVEDHGVAIAVQAKKRSWDTMPNHVQKPYATTTICHLLEIAAMLGIYWREFDRSKDKYRAEGNGYILTGTKVSELGITFTFQLSGKRRFMENRVIPVHEVKELCCGTLSTIFRENRDDRMLELLEESKDLSWLQLGSMNEIAESLILMGCNTNTANYFRVGDKKNTHLFPGKSSTSWKPLTGLSWLYTCDHSNANTMFLTVAFELVGMLGKPLHIRNTCFRMVPNPTPCHWDKKFFSLRRMMKELRVRLMDDDLVGQSIRVQRLSNLADSIERIWRLADGPVLDYDLPLLESLHDAIEECDKFLKHAVPREMVTLILREHFQVVLRMINNPDQAEDSDGHASDSDSDSTNSDSEPTTATSPTGRKTSASRHHHRRNHPRELRFGDLYAASPEERQAKFMDIYFAVVLPAVRDRALKVFNRRASTRYGSSTGGFTGSHRRDASVGSVHSASASVMLEAMQEKLGASGRNTPVTPISPSPPPARPQLQPQLSSEDRGAASPIPRLQVPGTPEPLTGGGLHRSDTENPETQATNIWCTLVFRMCCWLLLHDFHRKDVQIPKSEMLGSRLPVYII
jgi:hypothetical protein